MTPSRSDSLRWTQHGTELVARALADLDDAALHAPSALPGWTRAHVGAHLALNAEALGNLVHWAATGERTPMYASPEQRAADIEAGSRRSADELRAWFERSAARLASDTDRLTEAQWLAEVATAQGLTRQAREIPWMRAREVMVHAVDLGVGLGFADLPADFLDRLRADITGKRGEVPALAGPPAEITAYLAGRPATGVTGPDGGAPPALPPWL
jgi:maleylpyruvate isomerase